MPNAENERELFERDVSTVLTDLGNMLVAKNKAYGNSALDPVRIFSRVSNLEQILVRIDDKLSRLQRGSAAGEDVELDLLGYLVLLRVARLREIPKTVPAPPVLSPVSKPEVCFTGMPPSASRPQSKEIKPQAT